MLPPVLLILALVFVLITAICAVVRGFKRFYPTLIVIAASVPAALVITLILKGSMSAAVSELLHRLLEDVYESGAVETMLDTMPTAASFVEALPAALTAPFIFSVCYALILIVAEIVRAIVTSIVRCKKEDAERKAEGEKAMVKAAKEAAERAAAKEAAAAASADAAPAEGCELPAETPEAVPASAVQTAHTKNEPEPAKAAPVKKSKAPDKLLGLAAGLVGGFVVALCFMFPLIGYVGMASATIDELNEVSPETMEELFADSDSRQAYDNFVEPILTDPFVSISYKLGGKALMNTMSSVRVDGQSYPVSRILSTALSIFGHIDPLMGKTAAEYDEEQADAIADIVDDLDRDVLLKNLAAEFIAAMASEWEDGYEFMGVAPPTSEGRFAPVLDKLIATLATTNNKTIVSDLTVVSDIIATLIKYDATALLDGDSDRVTEILSTPGFISELCTTVQQNERMEPVFFELTKLGVAMVADMLGIPEMPQDIPTGDITIGGTKVTVESITQLMKPVSPENAAEEAKKLEAVVTAAIAVADSLSKAEGNPLYAVDSKAVEDIIVNLSETETFGDAVSELLQGIGQSELLADTGFSGEEIFKDITDTGYDNISNTIDTVKHTSKMLETLTSTGTTDASGAPKEDVQEEIEWLISNMTPETCTVISNQVNEETLKNYGVPDEAAEPVSDLITNMLSAMSEENAMTEEEYKNESDAINHLFEVATELAEAETHGMVFDDKVASAADIAETVLSSKVVSSALVGTAYDENGKVKDDPLNLNVQLTGADKASLISALNTYSTANLPSAADAQAEKEKITALAAIFNVDINIAANGKVTAK